MKKERSKEAQDRLLEAYHTVIQDGVAASERLRAHAVILRQGIHQLEPMAAMDRRDAALADLCEVVADMATPHSMSIRR